MLSAGDARRMGRDDEERRLLGGLGIDSAITVPLAPRGAPLGALLLGTRSPRPRLAQPDDVEYAETLAGRVGLALDNAVLSAELSTVEQQLQVILGSVDAAVTVRDRHGRMVYANQAAADLLKLPDPAAVLAHAPGGLMARFDVYTEDGEPVDITGLAGTRLLLGESAPEAMIVRNVVKATGEERWLLNKATAVTGPERRDPHGGQPDRGHHRDQAPRDRSAPDGRDACAPWPRVPIWPPRSRRSPTPRCRAWPTGPRWTWWRRPARSGRWRSRIATRSKVRQGWYLNQRWPADHESDGPGGGHSHRRAAPRPRDHRGDARSAAPRIPSTWGSCARSACNSAMIAPIRSGDRVLGALSFVSSTSRRFDERDLALASDLGRQAGVIVDSAELQAAQSHIAQTLQAGLIPRSLPAVRGVGGVQRLPGGGPRRRGGGRLL